MLKKPEKPVGSMNELAYVFLVTSLITAVLILLCSVLYSRMVLVSFALVSNFQEIVTLDLLTLKLKLFLLMPKFFAFELPTIREHALRL